MFIVSIFSYVSYNEKRLIVWAVIWLCGIVFECLFFMYFEVMVMYELFMELCLKENNLENYVKIVSG